MLQIEENRNIVYTIARGKLDDEDYDQILPLVRSKVKEYGKVSWYFQMEDFKGWTMNAFWRDLQFDFRNSDKMEKIAMVGENKWEEVMSDFMKPFTRAEIRYFDLKDKDEARKWIES